MKKILPLLIISTFAACEDKEKKATIITTNSHEIILENLQTIHKNTIVVFDCDDTLIRFKDAVLQSKNDKFIQKRLLTSKTKDESFLRKKGTVLLNAERTLVHHKLPEIVKNIQNNAKTLVITAAKEQNCGVIRSVIDWRIDDLKKFGFYFGESWPNLHKKELKKGIWFDQGIVFSNGIPKSKAFQMFLEYSEFTPQKVVFIDDKRENVEDMKTFCQKKGFEFLGVHYIEAFKNESRFSEEIATFQLNYLQKHDIWLGDQEANDLIEKSGKI